MRNWKKKLRNWLLKKKKNFNFLFCFQKNDHNSTEKSELEINYTKLQSRISTELALKDQKIAFSERDNENLKSNKKCLENELEQTKLSLKDLQTQLDESENNLNEKINHLQEKNLNFENNFNEMRKNFEKIINDLKIEKKHLLDQISLSESNTSENQKISNIIAQTLSKSQLNFFFKLNFFKIFLLI